jgi:hypothetical protein
MKILLTKIVIILGFVSIAWQLVFLILYFSSSLPIISEGFSDFIMKGAGVCGVIGSITCYFPYLFRHRISWLERREGSSVALSFVILFFSLGVAVLVKGAYWIGSM